MTNKDNIEAMIELVNEQGYANFSCLDKYEAKMFVQDVSEHYTWELEINKLRSLDKLKNKNNTLKDIK